MLQHFQLLYIYFSLIVWKAPKKKKQQSERRKTARREKKYNHKNMHTQKKCKFFQNKFRSTAVCAFLSTNEHKQFRLFEWRKKESSCGFVCNSESESLKTIFLCLLCVNIFFFGISCMQ